MTPSASFSTTPPDQYLPLEHLDSSLPVSHHIPDSQRSDQALNLASGIRTAHIIYLLQACALLTGVSLIPAFLVGLVKKGEIKQTWLRAHYRWQLRTTLNTLFWVLVGVLLLEVVIGYFVLIWALMWYCYRIAKGWRNLYQGNSVYSEQY